MGFKKNKKYAAIGLITLTIGSYGGSISFADDNKLEFNMGNESSYEILSNIESRGVNAGPILPISAGGIGYEARAIASTSVGRFMAEVQLKARRTVQKGKMAVSVGVYDRSGSILHSTGFKYNGSATTILTWGTRKDFPVNGNYYAGGYARVYAGGFKDYKVRNVASPKFIVSEEQQKERDEMYEMHKMIPAISLDNKRGYILEKDLLGEIPNSPEDALSIQKNRKSGEYRLIPVYDKDSKTVIGEFRIDE